MTLLFSLLAGLAAGAVHALSGPDHLAAVAPLADRNGLRTGALWGAGHAVGVGLLGGLALLAREWIDPAWVAGVGERFVGAGLVVLGIWGLVRAASRLAHAHPHDHGDGVHTHIHLHVPGHRMHAGHTHAALAIGTLHGFAGGVHLLAFLPALALPGRAAAAGYVGGFALGTMAGMAVFAALMGRASAALGRRPRMAGAFLGATSCAAILVGLVWILQKGGI